jgi:hypothetical protein
MAIDQRDVSSTLRFMDDRALQQYAAMYKNDPYIFPLAFQESQNRQRLRMSQQGAQGMQPQPKVNEQALAQMAPQQLPEQMGIGALPADNMQQMADGGIAGYDDADFVSRSEPVVMMADGGVARYQVGGSIQSRYQQESQEMVSGNRVQYSPDVAAYAQQLSAEESAARNAARNAAENTYLKNEQQRMLRGPYADAAPAAPQATMPEAGYTRGGFEGDPRLNTPPSKPFVAAPKVDAAPKPDTTRRNTTDPSAARKEPVQASDQFDVDAMMSTALAKQRATPDPLEKDLAAVGADKKALEEDNVAGLEAINKKFDNIFAGKKERLATREGEIAKMKDQSLGLALLNAGARMMQTRGSIGEAIGAGIDTGSKQYVAGLDKINSAKEKLSDARDRLEELEAQRGEMSARELHKANQDVKRVGISVKEDMIRARMAFNNETYAKAEKAVTAQLNANLEVYKQQQANVRNKETASAYSAATRQDQVSISALKAQADVINKQLEAMGPPLKSTAAKRKPLEDELARITSQLQQLSGLGTMTPPPGGGNPPDIEALLKQYSGAQ